MSTYEEKMVDAGILVYEEGSEEYGYVCTFHDGVEHSGTILLVDGPSYAGTICGRDPREAARNVIRARSDILDDAYCTELEPVFTVERNADGSFTVEVETHGLGDATIQLMRAAPCDASLH